MDIDQLIDDFSYLGSWEDRYAYVLELGRDLAPLSEAEHNEASKVEGCVSQVWLVTDPLREGKLYFRGDSDSLIVRGLIAILMILFSGRTPAEIIETEPAPVMARLGLDQHLTPQRANGLAAMIKRIQAEAAAALSA